MRARLLLVLCVLCTLLAIGCGRLKPKSSFDSSSGPIEFDASLPRVVLPSRARDSVAPAQHALVPLATTSTEIRGGREPTRFEAIRVRGVVEGQLALTEIHLAVRNLEERTVETTFTVNLPEGGAVTRFGMKNERSDFQEGRIAEARHAREVYGKLLQRGIDPGLVEIDGPDRVRVRLFPVAANQRWDVMLTVISPVVDGTYRVPLAGTLASAVDAQVLVGKQVMTYAPRGAPTDDLVVPLANLGAKPPSHITSGHTIVLVDSSASRRGRLESEMLRALAKEDTLLDVACFDQDVEVIHHGPARSFDPAKIAKREALGASDLGIALAWAAKASSSEKTPSHVVILTDNDHPLPTTREMLAPAIERLRASGAARIDLVLDRRHEDRGLTLFRDLGVNVIGMRPEPPPTKTPLGALGAAYVKLRGLTDPAAIRAQSIASGILTRETAYVVLESKEDYDDTSISTAEKKVLAVGRDGATTTTSRPPPSTGSRSTVTVDRDADGIPDQVDRCPDEDEDVDGIYDDDGCPEVEGAPRVLAGRAGLFRERIRFAARDASLSPAARKVAEEIATALRQSPRVGLVEIAGYSRALASPEEAMRVADARASAVRALLIEKGVAPDRLIARPYGDRSPRGVSEADEDRVELALIIVDGKRRVDTVMQNVVPPPHNGRYSEVAALLADKAPEQALARAREWVTRSGDVLSYIALGNALAATGDEARAARAYGSVIDLVPERPAEWRAALAYLDALDKPTVELHRHVHAERPSYTSARGLSFALARSGQWQRAFETAMASAQEHGPSRTDAALLGAAWARVDPKQRSAIERRLESASIPIARGPSTQFVLTWESDATNVDLEIADARGGKANRSYRALRSGGEYKFDTRSGYGPDWFSIDGRADAGPYRIGVVYGARGAMGPVLGHVSIVEHDGNGNLTWTERPFVIMNERAMLDLGPLVRKQKDR